MEWLDFFRIAPQWATLLILGMFFIKQNPLSKLFGREKSYIEYVKREDCHSHVDALKTTMTEIKEDIKELRATIIKHIDKE